ncbi:MAG: quinohemoprotein amine dehydrogenase subunit beta [Proteobacteria bacterium]|nr:quinohemoprotein amine dehydrogenase subunit beta [Pseudomonadota bacterium]
MKLMTNTYWKRALWAGVTVVFACTANMASAKEYLITSLHSNMLVLVDVKARKVEKTFPLPSAPGNTPATVVPSPDGKVAYVLHNRWETVSGIDLDTGKEVFRADLSQKGLRAKSTFALDVSPDGKEIAIFVLPVKMFSGEYQVQDTYIAVYDTASGLAAKPIRSFPAPRRTTLLAYSPDAKRLYAMGWDITVMDPKDGKVTGTHPVRHWERKNFGEPDTLAVWPLWGASNVYTFPYAVPRTDRKPDAPDAMRSGIYTLDLATDKASYKEFENSSVVLFSAAINPVRRKEAYSVYTTLSKIDLDKGKLVKRIDLEQTYYVVPVSRDGKELYLGGAGSTIAIYDAATFKRLGTVRMPGDADQATATMRYFTR